MIELSRRSLLAGGALALGSIAGAAAILSPKVAPATAEARVAVSKPVAAVHLGVPEQIASLVPTTSRATMQQVERLQTDELFVTQSLSGSGPWRYTTVVSRYFGPGVSTTANPEIDAMTILDGGHGLGLHVEPRSDGGHDVWTSLQGPVSQGDPTGGRLARFTYTPGVFAIEAIPGGVTYLPQFTNLYGEQQESIYAFDWARGVAAERMYDFHTGRDERYTLRRITDIEHGIDRPLGRMTIPVDPPTMQGFTTIGSSFYRWVGVGNDGSGAVVASDPMAMEQFDWATGERVAITPFPTLGQEAGSWRDSTYEPEGCSVFRGQDGAVDLVVGVAVGSSSDHGWFVYRLPVPGSA